ncbi:MAG TPA: metallophosphoesterase [Rhizomicrobium sp.]
MKRLFLLAPLLLAACTTAAPPPELLPAPAIQMPEQAHAAWVQYGSDGVAQARIAIGSGTQCPALIADGVALPMTLRATADVDFPTICAAPIPKGGKLLSIDGMALPAPVAEPQRILVLGDTGCRIKGDAVQACNDPRAWPFAGLSAAAAAMHPDLVLHLGDYLYRESPCPKGNAGCAGSTYGDNWQSWNADFFAPAAPLLAAAPLILVRGNHEDCDRAGEGYLWLLGPAPWSAPCAAHLAPYDVKLDGTAIAVLDDSAAPDTEIDHAGLPAYAADIAGLSASGPVWLALHRPIWGLISGPLDIPIGGNATMIAAAGSALIPKNVALMLSGHIHAFEAINYDKSVPPQIVAGHGGDNLDATPRDLKGAIFQGDSGVRVKDGLSVPGFGFLMLTRTAQGWTIDLYDSDGRPERQCFFTPGAGGGDGRLDCAKP